jgi:outer membrane lipoprotein-sorting protein
MKRSLFALALVHVCFGGLWSAAAEATVDRTVEEIQECLRANAPSDSSIQTITMRAVDRMGTQTDSRAKIYWRSYGDGNKVLLRIEEPATRRGSALLMVEKGDRSDMWMYLPELRKTKRITQHSIQGSMFGTDLSYEDFERLQGLGEDADPKRLPDGELDGRATHAIEITPARGEESSYERIVAQVEQERCLPVRLELFETGGRLRKVMSFPSDQIKPTKKGDFPHLIRVEDRIDGTHTEIIIEQLEFDAKIPESYFSQSKLELGR